MKELPKQSGADSGHWLWFLQRITGVLLLCIIAFHWFLKHTFACPIDNSFYQIELPETWSYSWVIGMMHSTSFRTFYTLLLGMAMFHGFHGLWMVGRDYLHAQWSRSTLAAVCVTGAIIFFVWGAAILFGNYSMM